MNENNSSVSVDLEMVMRGENRVCGMGQYKFPYIPHADPLQPTDSPSIYLVMKGSTLATGRPDWLEQVEAKRKPIVYGGITYQERNIGTRQCLVVRDYADITDNAEKFNELLCVSDDGLVFVDLGDAPKDHDLIINAEGGTVYVNGHEFNGMAGLISIGDGSWGVAFDHGLSQRPKGFTGFVMKWYNIWLDEVYKRCEYLGLVDHKPIYNKSIWHLIFSDLPKGKIISEKSKLVLDKEYTS